MSKLPKISIITPSFNHGRYLEETIQSVLSQGYPNLEYIIVDGGSTDQSAEVIRKYEKYLAWWVSEKDRGQSHAINKGFEKSSGDVVNWLCSVDLLAPQALHRIGEIFGQNPAIDVLAGGTQWIFESGREPAVRHPKPEALKDIPQSNGIEQPSCFYRRRLLRSSAVKEELHYAMDFELWAYFVKMHAKWQFTDEVLSIYRFTGANKTSTGGLKAWNEWGMLQRDYSRRGRIAWKVLDNVCRAPLVRQQRHAAQDWMARHSEQLTRNVARALKPLCGRRSYLLSLALLGMVEQEAEMAHRDEASRASLAKSSQRTPPPIQAI